MPRAHCALRAVPIAAPIALLVAVLGMACACATTQGRQGIDDYHQGRYPEALAELRRQERESGSVLFVDAHYTLYRGLCELSVGNVHQAHAWLSLTKELVATHPRRLTRADRGRLEAAWHTLGRMPGQLR